MVADGSDFLLECLQAAGHLYEPPVMLHCRLLHTMLDLSTQPTLLDTSEASLPCYRPTVLYMHTLQGINKVFAKECLASLSNDLYKFCLGRGNGEKR